MVHSPKVVLCFIVTSLVVVLGLYGQNQSNPNSYQHQVELRHDNDFFLLTDRYYSSGLFLTYRKLLSKGFFKTGREQLDFTIGQEVYTPSQTQSTNTQIFDRPYVGFSGLNISWSISKRDDALFRIRFLTGIAGLNSGAGGFQRWYHRALGISESPLWLAELSDSFHLNAYFSYVKEWELIEGPFGIRLALQPNIAFGSRDIYAEPETIFFFGQRNTTGNSIAYDRLGATDKEIYFALRASYRHVLHNGLLEGNLLGDNSVFLQDATTGVWRFGFDFYHRIRRNDYKLGIRYNSPETEKSKIHKYVMLSYGLRF